MSRMLDTKTMNEIRTNTAEGWRLWHTVDDCGKTEYVLSANVNTPHTVQVMTRAMTALLRDMQTAVALGDGAGMGQCAYAAMKQLNRVWPDCRLMARSAGALFVAVSDENDHSDAIAQTAQLICDTESAGAHIVGFAENRLPEVCFAGLFNGSADLEVRFTCGEHPMLSFRSGNSMSGAQLWERLRGCWQHEIAC